MNFQVLSFKFTNAASASPPTLTTTARAPVNSIATIAQAAAEALLPFKPHSRYKCVKCVYLACASHSAHMEQHLMCVANSAVGVDADGGADADADSLSERGGSSNQLFDSLALEGSSGAAAAHNIEYPCELLMELLAVPDVHAASANAADGVEHGSSSAPDHARVAHAANTLWHGGDATECESHWTSLGSVEGASLRARDGEHHACSATEASSEGARFVAAATGGEQRRKRRREFHKIHTRRSRAKLNEKLALLRAVLPEPPADVVVKSKAQVIDYAISVLARLQQRRACHTRPG
eukprot:TRINITY_DN41213_c0_g1_i1.p1 TRINITY_DN41213_c0_g1~~TRINITY_DN41213_c0_g1_i1.p1  ORF type:complete len:295 (+),score=61.04 TRINITY_DN41213_c0_g1_i1:649-1533(+)